MDPVKVGVLGFGYWGPKLVRNFHALPEAQLEWVCDKDPDRLDHMRSLYPNVRATQNFQEMLESDLEAVCIASPVGTHWRLGLEALRAGKHVLIEKPLAACVWQAGDLIAEADNQHRVLMVSHTFLYNPAVTAVRELIARGELGRIYYLNSIRVNLGLFQPDINVSWDLAPHDISILMYILDSKPLTVSARGGIYVQRGKGLHDMMHLSLDFPDGVLADIRVSWLDPCKIRTLTVVGSEKMLVYDDIASSNKVMIYNKGVDIPPYSDTLEEFHLSYRTGDAVPYPIKWEEPLAMECRHFLDCIRRDIKPLSDGQAGLEVIRVLEALQCSLLNDGTKEMVGNEQKFCAHRTRRDTGPRCQDLCVRQPVRVPD
jgi:predicted dehydrogenase